MPTLLAAGRGPLVELDKPCSDMPVPPLSPMPLLLLVSLILAPSSPPPSDADAHLAQASEGAGSLSVRLGGFRSADGQVLVALFRGEAGFPSEPQRAWKTAVLKIDGENARLDLQGVPAGTYAISVIHDENGNNALDTNFLGIPKEGIGTSNNAKARFGPPKWADARFEVQGPTIQRIRMVYY